MSIRYQHIRFYKLKIGEDFFVGKLRYEKRGHFSAQSWRIEFITRVRVMPWTRVRSTRPYGKQP